LARWRFKVVLRNRKKETVTMKTGDDFLYGDPISLFCLSLYRYQRKWRRRFEEESDDREAAPGTWSSCFSWEGVEDNRIPWFALKSAWRRMAPMVCLNCERQTLVTNFGYCRTGMLNRYSRIIHTCFDCRRSFDDTSVDAGHWIRENLDSTAWPDYDTFFGRRKWNRG
jgi:hypothetical protein